MTKINEIPKKSKKKYFLYILVNTRYSRIPTKVYLFNLFQLTIEYYLEPISFNNVLTINKLFITFVKSQLNP